MNGIGSKILIGLGIVLIFISILWWAIAVNALVKLPDDIDVTNNYEGTMTFYIDPLTRAPAPEGSDTGISVEQKVVSDKEQFDSERGVIGETLTTQITDMPVALESRFAYVLDRKTNENVADDRAYAWDPENVVNREGNYYPLFPFDTAKDGEYSYWKSEVGKGFTVESKGEEEKQGITVYNFGFKFEGEEVEDAYLDTLGFLGLKKEMTLEDVKPTLAALGIDLDAMKSQFSQAITNPADLQAVSEALSTKMGARYYWAADMEFSIEPRTGTPLDIYRDIESLSMELDTEALAAKLQPVLAKYAGSPVLGPTIQQVSEKLAQMEGTQKIFEYDIKSTDETVKNAAEEAKTNAGHISVVKVYIPWALLIVGALILIIGLLVGGGQETEAAAETGGEEEQ